ncbi:MAG: hypothetical protein AB1776_02430 [Bacillota bacterium]
MRRALSLVPEFFGDLSFGYALASILTLPVIFKLAYEDGLTTVHPDDVLLVLLRYSLYSVLITGFLLAAFVCGGMAVLTLRRAKTKKTARPL